MNVAVARELKSIRIKKNLRMEDVAKENDLSCETLRRYEKDAANIPIKTLEKLLEYYKMPPAIFFENVCVYNHGFQDAESF